MSIPDVFTSEPVTDSLKDFLEEWDCSYLKKTNQIPLFKYSLTEKWSGRQKMLFAKLFYHSRGHFHDFLWFLGSNAPDKETKEIVLQNIAEEFNGSAASHEQMYIDFAESLGVTLMEEFVDQKHYLPFIRDFNKGHIRWMLNKSSDAHFSAFAAYERLDNVDYENLLKLAESLKASRRGLIFFKVHMRAKHFSAAEMKLQRLWEANEDSVKEAFFFIANHQLEMWQSLSDKVFLCEQETLFS